MKYLEQFAQNRKKKGKTEVITARLPENLYNRLKDQCDNLGLSISEAICLLVEFGMTEIENETEIASTKEIEKSPPNSRNSYYKKNNDDVYKLNTKTNTTPNTSTVRFTTKPWQVNGDLPCPYCNKWFSASNFSRHAKQHATDTQDIFMNEIFTEKINEMIQARTAKK